MNSRVPVVEAGEGQARSTLATVRALAPLGINRWLPYPGATSVVTASRHRAGTIRIPSVEQEGFRDAIEKELAFGEYLTTMVTADAALLALGAPVEHLVDKTSLAQSTEGTGLQSPPTEQFETRAQLQTVAAHLRYPVVIKTVFSGAPVQRIDDASALAFRTYSPAPC